jgi:ribosomal-protein-alanine N-acetyltransferase
MWHKPVRLVTDRLIVREASPREARRVHEFLASNRGYHTRWEPSRPHQYFTIARQRVILRRVRRDPQTILLFLYPRDDRRRVVGSITFSNILRGAFRSCFLGYRLDRGLEGRGLMSEALSAAITYVFQHEQIHRIEANIMPDNERSIRLVRRLGFRHEGTARRYLNIQGRWEDHDHYVLLEEDTDLT